MVDRAFWVLIVFSSARSLRKYSQTVLKRQVLRHVILDIVIKCFFFPCGNSICFYFCKYFSEV